MTTYYEVKGMIEGEDEVLFGSFVKADCQNEMADERANWKEQGYKQIKIMSFETDDTPDPEIYTAEELNPYTDHNDQ